MSKTNNRHLINVHSELDINGKKWNENDNVAIAKAPSVDDLSYGEIAVNNGKGYEVIFVKNSNNEVVPLPNNQDTFILTSAVTRINESVGLNENIKYLPTADILKGQGNLVNAVDYLAELVAALYEKIKNLSVYQCDDTIPPVNESTTPPNNEPPILEAQYEYVDLGLPSGLKWAKCNVGATKPEEYGLYFQWGDISGYTDATHSTWSTCPFNGDKSYYSSTEFAKISGDACPNGVLAEKYDAAHANMGGSWRMPTSGETTELKNNTTSEWTTENGVYGRKFTSKVDSSKYIFIPTAGYVYNGSFYCQGYLGYVWSSSLDSSNPYVAYSLDFSSSSVNPASNLDRVNGFSVRGVMR